MKEGTWKTNVGGSAETYVYTSLGTDDGSKSAETLTETSYRSVETGAVEARVILYHHVG